MIEAVKSTVAANALNRAGIEQNSTLNSYGANPTRIQQISQAPYVSPTIRVDVSTKMAILEFRESSTGDVVSQIPSESQIRAYKLRQVKEDAQVIAQLTEKPKGQSVPQGAGIVAAVKTAATQSTLSDNPNIVTASDFASSDALLSGDGITV